MSPAIYFRLSCKTTNASQLLQQYTTSSTKFHIRFHSASPPRFPPSSNPSTMSTLTATASHPPCARFCEHPPTTCVSACSAQSSSSAPSERIPARLRVKARLLASTLATLSCKVGRFEALSRLSISKALLQASLLLMIHDLPSP